MSKELPLEDKNYMMHPEKFYVYMERIWKTDTEHGWNEQPRTTDHYLGLVMTEMAEAVEADRNGKRAQTNMMMDVMNAQAEGFGLTQQWYEMWFELYYNEYVNGNIEEEFVDVMIRILDMAYEHHGLNMSWHGYDDYGKDFQKDKSFVKNAWFFIKEKLNSGTMNINDSISYMYAWAEYLGIDIDLHIEWKMKYNELRPYKHGGKKY